MDFNQEEDRNEAEDILDNHISALMEHFSSVQITITKHQSDNTEGGTFMVSRGSGDVYARIGATKDWIEQMDERARQVIRNRDNDDA